MITIAELLREKLPTSSYCSEWLSLWAVSSVDGCFLSIIDAATCWKKNDFLTQISYNRYQSKFFFHPPGSWPMWLRSVNVQLPMQSNTLKGHKRTHNAKIFTVVYVLVSNQITLLPNKQLLTTLDLEELSKLALHLMESVFINSQMKSSKTICSNMAIASRVFTCKNHIRTDCIS